MVTFRNNNNNNRRNSFRRNSRNFKSNSDSSKFNSNFSNNEKKILIEIKNVTLSRNKHLAEFPDAITERGHKHIEELLNAKKIGFEVYLIFVVQRNDCKYFSIAKDIDEKYDTLLTKALSKGVNVFCYDCKMSTKGIIINKNNSEYVKLIFNKKISDYAFINSTKLKYLNLGYNNNRKLNLKFLKHNDLQTLILYKKKNISEDIISLMSAIEIKYTNFLDLY